MSASFMLYFWGGAGILMSIFATRESAWLRVVLFACGTAAAMVGANL